MERRAENLARVERWTEWPLTILALVLIPILLAPYVLDVSPHTSAVLDELDYLLWGIFAADFLVKLAIAPRRIAYLRSHWIDALLVLLPMLRPLRILRSMRAVRVLRAARSVTALLRVSAGVRRLLARHGFHYVLASAVLVMFVGGSLAVAFERDHQDASIRTLPDGIWWAITTMTTVGYGDMYPRTAAGRGVGVVMMLVGIALFGTVTANLAAYFVDAKEDETLAEVRQLRVDLARLESLIEAGRSDSAS